jgi:hypothetical protein
MEGRNKFTPNEAEAYRVLIVPLTETSDLSGANTRLVASLSPLHLSSPLTNITPMQPANVLKASPHPYYVPFRLSYSKVGESVSTTAHEVTKWVRNFTASNLELMRIFVRTGGGAPHVMSCRVVSTMSTSLTVPPLPLPQNSFEHGNFFAESATGEAMCDCWHRPW